MASVEYFSDSELRRKLAEYGYLAGPVTETSRKVLLKKLKLLMEQARRSSDVTAAGKWRRSSSRFSSGEEDSEKDDLKMRLNSSVPPQSSNFRTPGRKLSVESLSDSELRFKLEEYGYPAGPVTETSRNVLKKKLKLLMAQSGRSSDITAASKWRRSSSRFSSGEEDSENDDLKMRLNSSMPPPSSNLRTQRKKSTERLSEYPVTPGRLGRRKEMNFRNDVLSVPKTGIPESDPSKKRHSLLPPSPVSNPGSLSISSVRRLSSRPKVSSVINDGFETGSDSDIDSKKLEINTGLVLPPTNSPASVPCSSFLSRLSSVRPRNKSDYNGDDSSSANALLRFRKSFESTGSATNTFDSLPANRSTHSPFQSSFVKRLSGTFGSRGKCGRTI
jgi:membrane protein Man1